MNLVLVTVTNIVGIERARKRSLGNNGKGKETGYLGGGIQRNYEHCWGKGKANEDEVRKSGRVKVMILAGEGKGK